MSDKTGIQWTDATWPITNGCRRVSPGCEGCYAERLIATRLAHQPKYAGLAKMSDSGPRWTGESRLWEEHLTLPLRWRRPRRIFVANMGDLFYEGVPDSDIDRVFAVMALAPRHTFQVLTKRPERMQRYFADSRVSDRVGEAAAHLYDTGIGEDEGFGWCYGPDADWEPLDNVWLGVSVENQATADERIPLLLDTPAAVRFVSYEPALGPVDFQMESEVERADPDAGHFMVPWLGGRVDPEFGPMGGLDWVIVGGESGPGARPFDVAWARSTVEQCRAAGVACFVKQLGARPVVDDCWLRLRDRKGGDWNEWPEDLRVREFPETPAAGGDEG